MAAVLLSPFPFHLSTFATMNLKVYQNLNLFSMNPGTFHSENVYIHSIYI